MRLSASIAVIALLVVGLLGLILPIIPGVLFLFLAALLLTRISSRAFNLAYRQPWFRAQLAEWRQSGDQSMLRKLGQSMRWTFRALFEGCRSALNYLRSNNR